MGDSSVGALVPSVVKAEAAAAAAAPAISASAAAPSFSETTDAAGGAAAAGAAAAAAAEEEERGPAMAVDAAAAELDKDLLCPICMGMIKDAFLTACGHSFCYMCIVTHLNNKSDCPCCSHYLTRSHLFPNFLLDKVLKKTAARQIAKSASPMEHLRLALQQTGM